MAKKAKKPKKPHRKAAKVAHKAKKAEVRRKTPKKEGKAMAERRTDDSDTPNKRAQAESDRAKADRDKAGRAKAAGEPAVVESAAILSDDPMGQPPDSPVNPLAEPRDEVDLSGSPGSAGEYVPIFSEAGTRGHPPDPTDPGNPNNPTDPDNPNYPKGAKKPSDTV